MTVKHASKRVARSVQQIARDELGVDLKYTSCLQIVEKSGGRDQGVSVEEQACRLFEANRSEFEKLKKGPK